MLKLISYAFKNTTAVFLMLLAATTASAQDQSEKTAIAQADKLKTELKLNDEQYTKVLDINKDISKKVSETKKSTLDRTEKSNTLKNLNEEKEEKYKTVFTEEQFKAYEAYKANARKRLANGAKIQHAQATQGTIEPKIKQ